MRRFNSLKRVIVKNISGTLFFRAQKAAGRLTLLVLVAGLVAMSAGFAQAENSIPQQITALSVSEDAQTLFIQGSVPFSQQEAYHVARLTKPSRLVLEFPNTQLNAARTLFKFDHAAIREVEMVEVHQPQQAIRVTVYLSSPKLLKEIHVVPSGSSLALMTPKALPVPPESVSMAATVTGAPPVPEVPHPVLNESAMAGLNVIDDIYYRDGLLVVKSRTGQKIIPKNRFVLSDPGRVVIDLEKSVVADKAMLKPIAIRHEAMSQVRVGQFDGETVRLVIESRYPERLQMAYEGPDRSALSISSELGMSVGQLPSSASMGTVQDVKLFKDGPDTIIRLSANAPIVHRLVKEDGKIYLELANISSKQGWVQFDQAEFPQLSYVKMDALTPGEPNSKLVINTKASDVEMASRMSTDNKSIEIKLFDSMSAIHQVTSRYVPLGGDLTSGGRAPYAARVVVDPGHGGKDMGANREGLNEKDLNLAVALKLKRALEARGVRVYMTRSSDIFLPLPQITQITNEVRPDLFVSVHTNSSTNPAITGLETYYYTAQSVLLAKKVHNRIANTVGSPDRGVRRAMFYVIHHTSVPAILCEMGYISNTAERSELFTEYRKQKTADAIADGVVDYLRATLSASAKR